MDEACLEQLVDFARENGDYLGRLRTKLDSPLRTELDLRIAQAETENFSATPSSDFVDNVPQDLPSPDDYRED